MIELQASDLEIVATFKTAKIYLSATKHTFIVEAIRAYIPIEEFQEVFEKASELVTQYEVTKIIFDKRKLKVFHQPSMEWYFVTWKDQIYELGVKTIRKILPDDVVFRQSVKIGRSKIEGEYPEAKYHLMDIQYRESVEDALNS